MVLIFGLLGWDSGLFPNRKGEHRVECGKDILLLRLKKTNKNTLDFHHMAKLQDSNKIYIRHFSSFSCDDGKRARCRHQQERRANCVFPIQPRLLIWYLPFLVRVIFFQLQAVVRIILLLINLKNKNQIYMDLNGHGVVEMPQFTNSLKLVPFPSCLASGLKNIVENLF